MDKFAAILGLILTLGFNLAFPATAFAATALSEGVEPVPTIEMSATPAETEVGKTVLVTVTYRWPAGWSVEPKPDPAPDFRDAFISAMPLPQDTVTAEGARRVVALTLTATRSGAWALPRPTLTANGPHGPLTITAAPVIVQVGTSAAPAKLPPPIGLRLQAPPVAQARWPWLVGGGVIALSLLAVTLLIVLRRRQATASVLLTPAQAFTRDVDAAQAATDGKDLGAQLSLALRRYCGATWRFDGGGSTVREVAATLGRRQLPDDERRALQRLLERLDELRWSPAELPADQVRPLIADAANAVATVERRLAAEAALTTPAISSASPAKSPSGSGT